MGAPWALAYACLHLGLWEDEPVYPSPLYGVHASTWTRSIDVWMVWTGTTEELHEFIRTSFLNLISIYHGSITTSMFRKETAANTLLHATRHQSELLVQGIPMGQYLRRFKQGRSRSW